jgi:hypothetical protein
MLKRNIILYIKKYTKMYLFNFFLYFINILLIFNYYFHIFAINNVVYKQAFDKNNDQYFKFMCSV